MYNEDLHFGVAQDIFDDVGWIADRLLKLNIFKSLRRKKIEGND